MLKYNVGRLLRFSDIDLARSSQSFRRKTQPSQLGNVDDYRHDDLIGLFAGERISSMPALKYRW